MQRAAAPQPARRVRGFAQQEEENPLDGAVKTKRAGAETTRTRSFVLEEEGMGEGLCTRVFKRPFSLRQSAPLEVAPAFSRSTSVRIVCFFAPYFGLPATKLDQ